MLIYVNDTKYRQLDYLFIQNRPLKQINITYYINIEYIL